MMPAIVPIIVPSSIINSACHCRALMKPCCMWMKRVHRGALQPRPKDARREAHK